MKLTMMLVLFLGVACADDTTGVTISAAHWLKEPLTVTGNISATAPIADINQTLPDGFEGDHSRCVFVLVGKELKAHNHNVFPKPFPDLRKWSLWLMNPLDPRPREYRPPQAGLVIHYRNEW